MAVDTITETLKQLVCQWVWVVFLNESTVPMNARKWNKVTDTTNVIPLSGIVYA